MNILTDIFVKEERELIDINDNESLPIALDVKVKVEYEAHEDALLGELDWSIDNYAGNKRTSPQIIPYDELTEPHPQKCYYCLQIFYDSFSLIRHNLQHLHLVLERVHHCASCSLSFTSRQQYDAHTVIHTTTNGTKHIKQYKPAPRSKQKCNICNKMLTYKSWHTHLKDLHSNKEFECAVCEAHFKSLRYLKRHVKCTHNKQVTQDVKLKCEECSTVLNSKNALTTHMRNCHTQNVQCSVCKSTLKSRAYLLAHMRRVHYDDGKEHPCNMCAKKFRSPRYLKVHKKNAHSR